MKDFNKMIRSIIRIVYSCKEFLDKKITLECLISFVYENSEFVYIDILKNKISEYIDIFEETRSWYFDYNDSKDLTDKDSFDKKYNDSHEQVLNLYDFIVNFCKKNNIYLFIECLDGLIIYGKYKYYFIYIAQDPSTNEYTLYLWKKDTDENGLEFNMKNKEELQKFFEDNDILVQWEENNLS